MLRLGYDDDSSMGGALRAGSASEYCRESIAALGGMVCEARAMFAIYRLRIREPKQYALEEK